MVSRTLTACNSALSSGTWTKQGSRIPQRRYGCSWHSVAACLVCLVYLFLCVCVPLAVQVEHYISREGEACHLVRDINWKLNQASKLHLVGNPRGYGKSTLVEAMAFMRNQPSPPPPVEFGSIGRGGVFKLSFADCKSVEQCENRLDAVYESLFCNVLGSLSIFGTRESDEAYCELTQVTSLLYSLT
jgi:hypothetical protein